MLPFSATRFYLCILFGESGTINPSVALPVTFHFVNCWRCVSPRLFNSRGSVSTLSIERAECAENGAVDDVRDDD